MEVQCNDCVERNTVFMTPCAVAMMGTAAAMMGTAVAMMAVAVMGAAAAVSKQRTRSFLTSS